MSHGLSSVDVETYREKGVLFPIPVLSPEEVRRARTELEALEGRLGGRPKAADTHQLYLYFRWAYDLATHPAVLDAVESVLGPNILVWATSVFTKYPRDTGFVSWHQDGTYWGLDSGQVTTAWIGLSESSTENGCMRVVEESQKLPIQRHIDTYADDNLLSRGQEIACEVDEKDATDVVLAAGEMSLHHVNIIHGSNANLSDKKRIGFTVRYVTPEVKQTLDKHPVTLARGEDRCGHFPLVEKAPSVDQDPEEALRVHREETRKHMEALRKTKGAYEAD
jgi:non-heme Fe2+,alpha-ketoglutarate-dependent halogenase